MINKERTVVDGITYQKTSINTVEKYKKCLVEAFTARNVIVHPADYQMALASYVPSMHEVDLNKIIDKCNSRGRYKDLSSKAL